MTLTLENMSLERNGKTLFNKINYIFVSGELLQICGANGSGKSTLLRILAGLLEPDEGNVSWQGTSILHQREQYQQQLHYIGHQNGIKPHLTVYENLKLYSSLMLCPATLAIKKAIEQVGLKKLDGEFVSQLSAGQQRRLSLARLLLHTAPIWILDEPMTALDNRGQALLIDMLEQHLRTGGIAIIATHQEFALSSPAKILTLGDYHA